MTKRVTIRNEGDAQSFVAMNCDVLAMERLRAFSALLLEENQNQNLISRPSEGQIWQRHIADSAQLLLHVPRETLDAPRGEPWLDLGTGAGFPGIVIAAMRPKVPVALIESRARRVEFLARSAERLGLTKCLVIGERLERVSPFEARVISARAFAPLEKLLHLSAPFSTKQTRYVLPKGRSAAHELNSAKQSIRAMFHVEQSLTDSEAGIIVSA